MKFTWIDEHLNRYFSDCFLNLALQFFLGNRSTVVHLGFEVTTKLHADRSGDGGHVMVLFLKMIRLAAIDNRGVCDVDPSC